MTRQKEDDEKWAIFGGGKDPEELVEDGIALYTVGKYTDALDRFNAALEIDPASSTAWLNKGGTLTVLGRYDEAHAAFEQALKLDSGNALVLRNKGITRDLPGKGRGCDPLLRPGTRD